jgi:hypothetical protein
MNYLVLCVCRFLLRYYPPGIILEYQLRDGTKDTKEIDLLRLSPDTDVEVLVNQIIFEQPLINPTRKPQLRKLIQKLISKLDVQEAQDFFLFKILRAHILPLTNCAFNKSGEYSEILTPIYLVVPPSVVAGRVPQCIHVPSCLWWRDLCWTQCTYFA